MTLRTYGTHILPAVLAQSENDFRARIMHRALRECAPLWHVDVLDGSMFDASCWADAAVVGTWHNLPDIELHVMTHNPLVAITAWHAHVRSLRRVLFHAEVARPLGALIERATAMGLETGLALNPETRLERVEHHLHDLDVIQVMGVHPGGTGRPFVGDPIIAKIARARQRFPHLVVAVDGGVTLANARALCTAGATRLVCGSVLWSSDEPGEAYHTLCGIVQSAEIC